MESTNPLFEFIRKRKEGLESGIHHTRNKRSNIGVDERTSESGDARRLSVSAFVDRLLGVSLKPTILHDIVPLGTNTNFARKIGVQQREGDEERNVCKEQAEHWMRQFREKLKETKGNEK